jgi:glycine C-acetyltransferase
MALRFIRSRRGLATATAKLRTHLQAEIDGIHAAGTYKHERVITSPQRSEITVEGSDEKMLNFCANNYLGLSADDELIEAAKVALDTHGFGLSSVRFICGTQDIHKELEDAISKFHGTEATILYPSCFDANAGLFEQMLGPEDAVLSDALNHASIIDGIRLCKAQRFRYNHLDMEDLEKQLQEASDARFRLIVTDGAFSMDGDIAPLEAICELAEKYDALTYIDECHATGFLGATGRGTDEACGVQGKIDVINSTLGKALGGATGGYTTGRKEIVEVLRQRARPYLFSNSLAPPLVAASLKVFERLEASSELVDKLRANTHRFRDALGEAGFTLSGNYDHPIAPVMLGDARLASDFADKMLERGIYVIGFSFPVVPKGAARIRTQLSAAHTFEQIDRAAAAFIEVGKELDVI